MEITAFENLFELNFSLSLGGKLNRAFTNIPIDFQHGLLGKETDIFHLCSRQNKLIEMSHILL